MQLEKFLFFQSLDKKEILKLKNITIKKNYKKKDVLFYTKDEPKYLYLLASGEVKFYEHDSKGNEILLYNLTGPNIITEIANFEKVQYSVNCSFESDSEVYLIDCEKFREQFLNKSEISMVFIKSLTKKIKALENFINYSITADSYTKIAKFIYENEDVLKCINQVKIASILNITPETLSRNITKLKQQKIIDKNNGYIKIINHEKLKLAYM